MAIGEQGEGEIQHVEAEPWGGMENYQGNEGEELGERRVCGSEQVWKLEVRSR